MAMGICVDCGKLTFIRPGSQQWGSRQIDWYPVEHTEPLVHAGCGGELEADATCKRCKKVIEVRREIAGGDRCITGPKRAIK